MQQGPVGNEAKTATNLLQLLLCQAANLKNPNTGRAYFNPEGKRPIPGMAVGTLLPIFVINNINTTVELWRGFFQGKNRPLPADVQLVLTTFGSRSSQYLPNARDGRCYCRRHVHGWPPHRCLAGSTGQRARSAPTCTAG
jgi:hypothetical protein